MTSSEWSEFKLHVDQRRYKRQRGIENERRTLFLRQRNVCVKKLEVQIFNSKFCERYFAMSDHSYGSKLVFA